MRKTGEQTVHRGIPTLILILLVAAALGLSAWRLNKSQAQNTTSVPATASRPVPAAGWGPMRIMTANVRLDQPADGDNGWLKRREFVLKTMLKYQPEIIACQELSPAQGAYLTKELSQWYAYYPRAGVGTRSTTAASQPRSAAAELLGALSETLASLDTIYYRHDRFDIIDGEAGLVLPKEPQANASENTFFSMAVLREKRPQGTTPATLLVIDIHFRHNEPFAIRCAREMRTKLDGWLAKYPGSGIIMLGDINRGRTTQLYAAIMATEPAASALTDSFDYTKMDAKVLNGTYQAFTGTPNATWPTDLIFFGGPLQVSRSAEILRDKSAEGRYPSDHYFVQTELKWK
jgi:endonuclease/exonuclease/phosphatase family metal-dependent hydrolase